MPPLPIRRLDDYAPASVSFPEFSFGATFKRARLRAMLTHRELEAKSGVSRQTVIDIERHGAIPMQGTMRLLCEALGRAADPALLLAYHQAREARPRPKGR